MNEASPIRRMTAKDFPQELLDLYDYYAHGMIGRREFLDLGRVTRRRICRDRKRRPSRLARQGRRGPGGAPPPGGGANVQILQHR